MASTDEIEGGSKVDHSININQIFAEKFKDLGNSSIKSHTMFKVNVWLRKSNPAAYTPKMVSIGPYHKRNFHLHQMEKYKWLYLQRFLGRKEGLDAESCIKELEGLKEEALKCYDDVETDGFCLMLLLDGCFVVEFIRECYGMFPEDKIMNSDICIVRDLILLENQLPFFVLDKLHNMTKRSDELALGILASIISIPFFGKYPETTIESFLEITGNIKHLLHLNHAISCHGNGMKKPKEAGGCYNIKNTLHLDDQTFMHMQNATELSEAGVSFAKASFKTGIFDGIKFENGLMKIPRFRVTVDTEILLRNLIAYEQQSVDVQPKHFTNFATFMDYLIDSDKDVNLLRQKGIIENLVGNDKEVASIFNNMGTGVTIYSDLYYKEECRKALKHWKTLWTKMKENLLQNYFSSPWVGASTVAAILLLILTLIQTILAFTGPVNK